MRISRLCHIILILLVSLTIVPLDLSALTLHVTLRIAGRIHLIAAVKTAVFLLTVRLGKVLAEEGRVAVPLAQPPSDSNSSTAITAVEAEVLPVVMFLMRLGRMLTSHLSTSPLTT